MKQITAVILLSILPSLALISYFSSYSLQMASRLCILAIISITVQLLGFSHASGIFLGNKTTEKYYDLIGSFTFLLVNLTCIMFFMQGFSNMSIRQIVSSSFVFIWSIRLGSFLFYRFIVNNGIDTRFTEIKKGLLRFLMAWLLQGVWVFVTSMPMTILNTMPDQGPEQLTLVDKIGILVWISGFLFECIADFQKILWRLNPKTHEKFINIGLWKISRHPNYFGEISLWFGMVILSSSSFHYIGQWLCLLSPFLTATLLIKISGINLLEAAADKKYLNDSNYVKYKQDTPVLIPFIGRKGNAPF
eukprot:gene10500-14111_t